MVASPTRRQPLHMTAPLLALVLTLLACAHAAAEASSDGTDSALACSVSDPPENLFVLRTGHCYNLGGALGGIISVPWHYTGMLVWAVVTPLVLIKSMMSFLHAFLHLLLWLPLCLLIYIFSVAWSAADAVGSIIMCCIMAYLYASCLSSLASDPNETDPGKQSARARRVIAAAVVVLVVASFSAGAAWAVRVFACLPSLLLGVLDGAGAGNQYWYCAATFSWC